MDGSPRGEGGKGLLRAGVALAGEQVAGRDDRAVAAPAQPPRDEQLQSRQLLHKLESEVRNLEVCAVVPLAAARQSEVPYLSYRYRVQFYLCLQIDVENNTVR